MQSVRQILLLMCVFVFLGVSRPACDRRTPDIVCSDLNITVAPGTCVEFSNTCTGGPDWDRVDGFRLCDEPNGLSVNTQRRRSGTTRELCATASIGTLIDEPVGFVYIQPGSFGTGTINVSTTALDVTATASPETIDLGNSSQLDANVTLGTPPFTFSWVPTPDLSDPNIQDPVATPFFTTTYTVIVTDFNGLTASNSVTVTVNSNLSVSAMPNTINVGETSQLIASVSGGTPPFSFSWLPGVTLDDPTKADPIASPTTTLTYLVTMTDGNGSTMRATVTVTVVLEIVSISATPSIINTGDISQLDVVVQGGLPPYAFQWTPNGSLNFDDIPNPVASPVTTTTYTVVVTDSDVPAQTVSDSVTVTVNPAIGPPTACFTPPSGMIPEGGVLLDASCSTPGSAPIVEWRWWSPWLGDPTFPPTFVSTTENTFLIWVEGGIAFDVRLEVLDGNGMTDDVINSYVVP